MEQRFGYFLFVVFSIGWCCNFFIWSMIKTEEVNIFIIDSPMREKSRLKRITQFISFLIFLNCGLFVLFFGLIAGFNISIITFNTMIALYLLTAFLNFVASLIDILLSYK